MRNSLYYIVLLSFLFLCSCKKDEPAPTTGTVTIDNTTIDQIYNVNGFLFSESRKISTVGNPADVLTISAEVDINNEITRITYNVNTYLESFFLFGEYSNATAASVAFENLKSFSNPQWIDPPVEVKLNQVWLFRTTQNKYAKIRVVNTVAEKRNNIPYAECTFEWEYQPDGTLTFPGK